jgi:hypothetical protein
VPHLLAAEALWQDRIIEVRYRRWSPQPGEVTRRLHPLGLVLKAGVWYLIATRRGQPRTYRVSAIVGLRPLPERSTRPDGFDLATFWREHVDRYERADTNDVAVVRLTPDGSPRFRPSVTTPPSPTASSMPAPNRRHGAHRQATSNGATTKRTEMKDCSAEQHRHKFHQCR